MIFLQCLHNDITLKDPPAPLDNAARPEDPAADNQQVRVERLRRANDQHSDDEREESKGSS